MYNFSHDDKSVDITIEGCFEPNLTTKIMLNAAIRQLSLDSSGTRALLELGCGSGVISTYLLAHGYMDLLQRVGLSDLSPQAVTVAETNISKYLLNKNRPIFDFKAGPGLQIWSDFACDLIINDISAISEAILPMNDWFNNAPNNAGIDGVSNSIQVLEEFASLPRKDVVMLMPVLSLSNVTMLKIEIEKLGLSYENVIRKSWPLPNEMVKNFHTELQELREAGHINFDEKFGQAIVETACYKIGKA
jgi:hypothetical protein